MMDFKDFLNWMLNSGGATLAASWLLERWSWFQSKSSDAKQYIFFGASAGLSLSAYLLMTYAQGFVAAAEPYFMILAGTFAAVFLGKLFHLVDKSR